MRKKMKNLFLIFLLFIFGCSPTLLKAPDVRQSNGYFCGAASFQSVLSYYGEDIRQDKAAELLDTTEEGTKVENICEGFKKKGLDAKIAQDVSIEDLKKHLKTGNLLMVAYQAWDDNYSENINWLTTWEDGHWSVVVGIDKNNIYIEDPSLLGSVGCMPINEFLNRWHDYWGNPPYNPSSCITYNHLTIFIYGNPAKQDKFTYIQ
jgi:uncharacterized protein